MEGKKIIQACNLDNGEEDLLACNINENNNLELEYPWRWLKKEDRKKLLNNDDVDVISDINKKTEAFKRNDLNHKRQKYAEKYIAIGIEKFWNDFLQISKKAFED